MGAAGPVNFNYSAFIAEPRCAEATTTPDSAPTTTTAPAPTSTPDPAPDDSSTNDSHLSESEVAIIVVVVVVVIILTAVICIIFFIRTRQRNSDFTQEPISMNETRPALVGVNDTSTPPHKQPSETPSVTVHSRKPTAANLAKSSII